MHPNTGIMRDVLRTTNHRSDFFFPPPIISITLNSSAPIGVALLERQAVAGVMLCLKIPNPLLKLPLLA